MFSGLKNCSNEIESRDASTKSTKPNDDSIDDENDESLFDDPLNLQFDEETDEDDEFEENDEQSQAD